ncbi:hypothetical protein DPMN_113768 [Dreissena polymorpha]|uniref:Uncharacterized protein n=1 Tax=Dreissena polymorpha TaxID=45954 RepID=A0A9D4KIL6_DREPO|nr:hypothetical protein DPMN_113768 [Dreissena polymorpha]
MASPASSLETALQGTSRIRRSAHRTVFHREGAYSPRSRDLRVSESLAAAGIQTVLARYADLPTPDAAAGDLQRLEYRLCWHVMRTCQHRTRQLVTLMSRKRWEGGFTAELPSLLVSHEWPTQEPSSFLHRRQQVFKRVLRIKIVATMYKAHLRYENWDLRLPEDRRVVNWA